LSRSAAYRAAPEPHPVSRDTRQLVPCLLYIYVGLMMLQMLPNSLLETVAAKVKIKVAARLAQTCTAANGAVQTLVESKLAALNVSKQWLIATGLSPLHFLYTGYLPLQQSIGNMEISSAFSSNGLNLATATEGDRTLKMWNLKTGLCERTFNGMCTSIHVVMFSPDGRWLVTCSDEATVQVFCVASAERRWLICSPDCIHFLQFSKDSSKLVLAADDLTMQVWSVRQGECIQTIDGWTEEAGHGYGYVRTAEFSPDCRELVCACEDKMARVWNILTGERRLLLEGHENIVTSADFSSKACNIVTGSRDQTVRVWNAHTGHCVNRLHGQQINLHDDFRSLVHCHPDHQTIVWTSNDISHELDILDMTTGQCLHRLLGHRGRLTHVKYTSHGQHIVSASSDNIRQWTSVPSVRQWSAVTGDCIRMFTGVMTNPNGNAITCYTSVDFSPDGLHVLAATWSGDLDLRGSADDTTVTHVGWLASESTAGLRACEPEMESETEEPELGSIMFGWGRSVGGIAWRGRDLE
jgi:WD40 repeat protein